jgi:hypothetical protein
MPSWLEVGFAFVRGELFWLSPGMFFESLFAIVAFAVCRLFYFQALK